MAALFLSTRARRVSIRKAGEKPRDGKGRDIVCVRTQALLDEREVRGGNKRGLQSGPLDTARRVWYQGINWLEVVRGFAHVQSYRVARLIPGVIPVDLDLAYRLLGHYGRDNQADVRALEI